MTVDVLLFLHFMSCTMIIKYLGSEESAASFYSHTCCYIDLHCFCNNDLKDKHNLICFTGLQILIFIYHVPRNELLYCTVVGSRRLMPLDALQPKAYCTNPGLQSFLLAPPGVSIRDPSSERRNYLDEMSENVRLPRNIQGSFTCRKSTTWGKRIYFPSERKRAEDFFALKNPTESAGFEPANLGTKGQHATSRPPKPLPRNETTSV